MQMDQDCIFCKIVAGQIPSVKIYEDYLVLAFMGIGPVSPGHVLLIPKAHYKNAADCPPEILASAASVMGQLAKAVSEAMGSDGYNILCNNGRAAGQLVDHVHFHIIPRSSGDGIFNRWPAFEYPSGRAKELADKIRAKL